MSTTPLYDPCDEHDNCGLGLVAAIDGRARRDVVTRAIEGLKNVWHRGAVDADGKTGDGAGIMIQVPRSFFAEHILRMGGRDHGGVLGVGQIFLPREDMSARETCRAAIEAEIRRAGYAVFGWRQVPVNISVIGQKAERLRPAIEQVLIDGGDTRPDDFERELYVVRRRIEKRTDTTDGFHICSFSAQSIVYKGLFLAEQLDAFYLELSDERFISNFAIFHQRYSTNTAPSWPLAQPFRTLAHNGEINTLRGNLNWLRVHETRMAHPAFGQNIDDLKPVVSEGASDSAAVDAVCELFCRAGRSAPMAKSLMIPEADPGDGSISDKMRAFYKYCNTVMEPWDGPAALAIYDGRWLAAGLDRNGLRPFRYTRTHDGLLIACSETGMIELASENIAEKGRIAPGGLMGVDLENGRFYPDHEMKDLLARSHDFQNWVAHGTKLENLVKKGARQQHTDYDPQLLRRRQAAFAMSMEDLETILAPMVCEGKEALGSMGDDTPLAVLSDCYRGLHHFFRQNFAQVTNPPIDSLRERRVMNLHTRLGNLGNILEEDKSQCDMLALPGPVLSNGEFDAVLQYLGDHCAHIDMTFPADADEGGLEAGLERVRRQAAEAVQQGRGHLVLEDTALSAERAAMPAILAAGAVHTHLIEQGLRSFATINLRSAECLDVHYVAVLVGVGATTVNAWLVQQTIASGIARGVYDAIDMRDAMANYKQAVNDGLLKIMSKMGISIISAYRGGCQFEAIGLSRALIAEYLPDIPSRISGIGLEHIQQQVQAQHAYAFGGSVPELSAGGFYRYRARGEQHDWEAKRIHMLQAAVTYERYSSFKNYKAMLGTRRPSGLRDLMAIDMPAESGSTQKDVEPACDIRRRFVTPGMSLGALSPEAHGTLNIAMNRIGAKSDSGEGGEDSARYTPYDNGDSANSAIKQCASARFGVTAEYLNQCREIEIKMAQGAKPGEGGQLPGDKVTDLVAKFRHATPGVSLISPPPHHDIYSIEDLAQLIYDLKQIAPEAEVCVKLVARAGIGTIAAGVAKAGADVILIAGHVGGTGASPQTSIKYAGVPWEMGLSEAHQVLALNGLRDRVKLRTDGGLKSGRDIVIAAMLGAQEFGIGTASVVAMGCLMVRQCHANTCPVGICTQDPKLREFFGGSAEKVVNLMTFLAEDVRDYLAALGFERLSDIIGRSDLLYQCNQGDPRLDALDLNNVLARVDTGAPPVINEGGGRNPVSDTLDQAITQDVAPLLERGETMELSYSVANTQRTVGARLSALITQRFGMTGLPDSQLRLNLYGSAGQSFGAFAVQGMKLVVYGDTNDYTGKGLSGGTLVIRPPDSDIVTQDNTIIGNTVLYGATAGKLFAAGQAGERFAVRNSGADVVIEGCGANACEYMTGGTVVIIGGFGYNLAAGMTGGMAYVYDPDNVLPARINATHVLYQAIQVQYYEDALYELILAHVQETGSAYAQDLLVHWQTCKQHFRQIIPREQAQLLAVSPFAAAAATADEAAQ